MVLQFTLNQIKQLLVTSINRSYPKQKTGLKTNKLTLNTDKSKTVTFKTKHDRSDVFTMNGKPLENVTSLSCLCITMDKKIDFREHSKRVEKKLIQFCGHY